MSKSFYTVEKTVPLKGNVVTIWSTDAQSPHPITPDLIMPKVYVQLLFVIEGSYKRRKLAKNHKQFIVDRSMIVGIQDKIIMSQKIGPLRCIGIQFDPMQFYLLFGDLGVKARNAHIPISETGHEQLIQLNKNIQSATSIGEALKKIENFLTDYSPKVIEDKPWRLTANCLHYIREKKGNTTIEKIGTSKKLKIAVLRTNFKKFIGFSPKELIKIIKTDYRYLKHPSNESTSFLSLADIFRDLKKN